MKELEPESEGGGVSFADRRDNLRRRVLATGDNSDPHVASTGPARARRGKSRSAGGQSAGRLQGSSCMAMCLWICHLVIPILS